MPNFERRHYRIFAELLKDELRETDMPRFTFNRLKTIIGNVFAADNPRFDRGRFEEACEP